MFQRCESFKDQLWWIMMIFSYSVCYQSVIPVWVKTTAKALNNGIYTHRHTGNFRVNPLVPFTDSSPLTGWDAKPPLVKIEVTELTNKCLCYICVMVFMQSETCSARAATFMETYSNRDCTCHRSKVSLDKFGNWSRLTIEKKLDKLWKNAVHGLFQQSAVCVELGGGHLHIVYLGGIAIAVVNTSIMTLVQPLQKKEQEAVGNIQILLSEMYHSVITGATFSIGNTIP